RMGVDAERGKPSITEFSVVKRVGDCTLVEARPLTGRRHQIRVHFYSIGHPIVGDSRYGDKAIQSLFPRLMLHAQEIEFRLPSGEEALVEAPVPESFRAVLESIRKFHNAGNEQEREEQGTRSKRDFKPAGHRRRAD
ncbi:MAG: RNA pseudouridine synthase, partial [Chloroflexi bacterium]|nr:RNA pseudouridine synthase [Chloroflexota bacterium]